MYPGSLPSSLEIQDEGLYAVMVASGECQYEEVYPMLSPTSVLKSKTIERVSQTSILPFRKSVSLALPKA